MTQNIIRKFSESLNCDYDAFLECRNLIIIVYCILYWVFSLPHGKEPSLLMLRKLLKSKNVTKARPLRIVWQNGCKYVHPITTTRNVVAFKMHNSGCLILCVFANLVFVWTRNFQRKIYNGCFAQLIKFKMEVYKIMIIIYWSCTFMTLNDELYFLHI